MQRITRSDWENLPGNNPPVTVKGYLDEIGTEFCAFVQVNDSNGGKVVCAPDDLGEFTSVTHSLAFSTYSDVPFKFEIGGYSHDNECEFMVDPKDKPNSFFVKSDTRNIPPEDDGLARGRQDFLLNGDRAGSRKRVTIDGNVNIMQMMGPNMQELTNRGSFRYKIRIE